MSHVAYFSLAHFVFLRAGFFSAVLQAGSLLGTALSRLLKTQAGFNAGEKNLKADLFPEAQSLRVGCLHSSALGT